MRMKHSRNPLRAPGAIALVVLCAALLLSVTLGHSQALALLLRGEADFLLTGTSQGWETGSTAAP